VRLPGATKANPWLFLAHVDTVFADPDEWQVDPFAAKISDGVVWGRGALDDKGMAAALTSALLRLAEAKEKPRRGIIAVFAADEETGSAQGVEWLLKQHPELTQVAGVVNEGGFTLLDDEGPAPKTYYVSVGEKGIAWLKLTATGTPGHGSIKWGNNANEALIRALHSIATWEHPQSAAGPLGQFAMADLRRHRTSARSVAEALKKHPLGKQVERDPGLRSSLSNTCNVTVLRGGEKTNVIPAQAEAMVDCRVIPGTTPEQFLAQVQQRIADDNIRVELLSHSNPTLSDWHTPAFATLTETALKLDSAAMVVPTLASGATDSRFWRERGINAYGIVPIPVPKEAVQGMHGIDERVPVAGVREAADFLTALMRSLANQSNGKQ
jgi:acetylornithine deacetylase/succinyl-diaminopimelate desuccinylase-like protein